MPSHLQFSGGVTSETFERITYRLIIYFHQRTYWKLDGCPYFSVYEIYRFVQGMRSLQAAAEGLPRFRAKVQASGLPDLHLNAVTWGRCNYFPDGRKLRIWVACLKLSMSIARRRTCGFTMQSSPPFLHLRMRRSPSHMTGVQVYRPSKARQAVLSQRHHGLGLFSPRLPERRLHRE